MREKLQKPNSDMQKEHVQVQDRRMQKKSSGTFGSKLAETEIAKELGVSGI
jgi:hypothetical protein